MFKILRKPSALIANASIVCLSLLVYVRPAIALNIRSIAFFSPQRGSEVVPAAGIIAGQVGFSDAFDSLPDENVLVNAPDAFFNFSMFSSVYQFYDPDLGIVEPILSVYCIEDIAGDCDGLGVTGGNLQRDNFWAAFVVDDTTFFVWVRNLGSDGFFTAYANDSVPGWLTTAIASLGGTPPAPLFQNPVAGNLIPKPTEVPGKEYSDNKDRGLDEAADPVQAILWDGDGVVENSGLDYGEAGEVDGLANANDVLFSALGQEVAALLFSTANDNQIYVEKGAMQNTALVGNVWATPEQINASAPEDTAGSAVTDIDGLEVWNSGKDRGNQTPNPVDSALNCGESDSCPPNLPDATRYSLYGDPDGVAVFDVENNPVFTTAQISRAIGLKKTVLERFDPDAIELDLDMIQPDLDAMMTSGQNIIFSIAPIVVEDEIVFDGGEIWQWDSTNTDIGAAQFLQHGGHLWDTDFDVMGTFNTASENINALEAVASAPEPLTVLGSAAALGFGVLLKRQHSKQRRKQKGS